MLTYTYHQAGGDIMKKFFRNLFSGYFLVLLILLIEIAAIVFIEFFLEGVIEAISTDPNINDHVRGIITLVWIGIRVVVFVISVLIFFRIVNKHEDPEFKIPWIVGMLLLPLFTSVIFLIFGNHGLNRRDKRIIKTTTEEYNKHFQLNEKAKKEYREELGTAVNAFRYINNITKLGIHPNNRVKYYATGEEFFPELIESLKLAKEFIFMEFFIISDGDLWDEVQATLVQKASEGVEIRIIYDDMGCGGTISARTPKILGKQGIKCYKFHPFRPILSGVYNNRDHRKIVIIDHQMAFTGGMNLADEYANKINRFGYWKDTMIKIEGSAINNLIAVFLQNLNLVVGHISDYNKWMNFDYPEYKDSGYVMPFGDGPGDYVSALLGEQTYINILNYAQKKVYISTPYLVPTYSLLDALRSAALRGVEVNLIVPGMPDKPVVYWMAKSNFRYLLDAGVNIYLYRPGFNHMKTAIADNELGFVGTINFDFRSLVHHFECGAILYKCPCMDDITKDFEQMIEVSEKVPQDYKFKGIKKSICSVLKIISALF